MMRIIITYVFALAVVESTFSQVDGQSGGWLQLNEQIISSDSYFGAGPGNELVNIQTNSYYITEISGEYGISKRLSANLSLPFIRVVVNKLIYNQSGIQENGGSLNSLGDAEIGLKYFFRKELPVQLIASISIGLPIGKKGDVNKAANLQTGDGEFNHLVGLELRQKFGSLGFSSYVSFNNRSEGYSNEIRYGFKCLYEKPAFDILIRYRVIESLFNDSAPVSLNGIYSNHRELFSPGAEVKYKPFDKVELLAFLDLITAGRNTLNGPLFGFGISLVKLERF